MSPSSPSNPKLQQLRGELDELNQQLLHLFQVRAKTVQQIQAEKQCPEGRFKSFDAQRELQLFRSLLARWGQLGEREWLAFTLLMEAHAGAPHSYPAWSEGVHLLEAPQRIEHRINPILLKLLRPEAFAALRLSSHFAFLHSL